MIADKKCLSIICFITSLKKFVLIVFFLVQDTFCFFITLLALFESLLDSFRAGMSEIYSLMRQVVIFNSNPTSRKKVRDVLLFC